MRFPAAVELAYRGDLSSQPIYTFSSVSRMQVCGTVPIFVCLRGSKSQFFSCPLMLLSDLGHVHHREMALLQTSGPCVALRGPFFPMEVTVSLYSV